MMRQTAPRNVYDTNKMRPLDVPIAWNRSSPRDPGSARSTRSGSSNISIASSKPTPCLARLLVAFAGFHSKSTCVLIDDGPAVRQQRCFFGSEAAARGKTPEGRAAIDILQRRGKADRDARRQIGQRVFEGVRAGPAHLSEERRQTRRAASADQPEPAIRGRPEDDIVTPEQMERRCDVLRGERRDVGADQYRGSRWAAAQGAMHALAEIAAALSPNRDAM